ncbi:Calx-beta domain-containing protein [Sphingomonas sp. ERG5]|uniref:Calx-beta domain-containing protein n=1 Tax=Sphingomonas sp. ERG5 TaxID=1381597 RepID=UPI003FA707B1
MNLSSPTGGATLGTATATGTINDNDVAGPPPSFAVSNAAGTAEGSPMVFTITKTGTTTSSYSVNYQTSNGTATTGSDFTSTNGMLTFAPNETSKTVSVPTIDDTEVELPESIWFTILLPTGGATITTANGTGNILDNDTTAPPPISFAVSNAAGVAEGSPMIFTVTKTGTTTSSYSVNYQTSNGTATTGSDFTSTNGTLTFAPNETSKTVSVPTIDDTEVELPESIWFTILLPTGGATVTTANGTGNILNND